MPRHNDAMHFAYCVLRKTNRTRLPSWVQQFQPHEVLSQLSDELKIIANELRECLLKLKKWPAENSPAISVDTEEISIRR
jgi:hypothetical protein